MSVWKLQCKLPYYQYQLVLSLSLSHTHTHTHTHTHIHTHIHIQGEYINLDSKPTEVSYIIDTFRKKQVPTLILLKELEHISYIHFISLISQEQFTFPSTTPLTLTTC